MNCVVEEAARILAEPTNPWKRDDGYYDQGRSPSCLFTSLVNTNIDIGADVMEDFVLCLAEHDLEDAWRRGIIDVPSDEYDQMLRCKEEVVDEQGGSEVLAPHEALGVFNTGGNDPCDRLEDAIEGPDGSGPIRGGGTIVTSKPDKPKGKQDRHSSSVTDIDCSKGTAKIRDPNGGEYEIEYDAEGNITSVNPPSSIYEGSSIDSVTTAQVS